MPSYVSPNSSRLTTWVVAGSEEDAASGFSDANDMACRRSTEDAILTDQELLDTICSTNLCNKLDHFWVPVSAISTNDEERTFDALGNGEEDGGDERLAVMGLFEDSDLFAKP